MIYDIVANINIKDILFSDMNKMAILLLSLLLVVCLWVMHINEDD